MTFLQYFKSLTPEQLEALCKVLGCSKGTFQNAAYGTALLGIPKALLLEQVSPITRFMSRPDVFGKVV